MKRLMMDLEFLALDVNSVVLSIGAVVIAEGRIVDTFYRNFKLQEQIDAGRVISESTLRWWLAQAPEIRGAVNPAKDHFGSWHPMGVSMVCDDLARFCDDHEICGNAPHEVWASSNLDVAMYEGLARKFGSRVPWSYKAVRDLRTLRAITASVDVGELVDQHVGNVGAGAHDALTDAIYQGYEMIERLNALAR